MIVSNFFCLILPVFASASSLTGIGGKKIAETRQIQGMMGLRNRGSDCFMNSCLQIFLASVGYDFLTVLSDEKMVPKLESGLLMAEGDETRLNTGYAMRNIFELAFCRENRQYHEKMQEYMDTFIAFVLSDSRNRELESLMKQYDDRRQHDLSEFMVALIDRLPRSFSDLFRINCSSIKKCSHSAPQLDILFFKSYFIQVEATCSRSRDGVKSLTDALNDEALDFEGKGEFHCGEQRVQHNVTDVSRLISAVDPPKILLIKINRTRLGEDAIANLGLVTKYRRLSESSEPSSLRTFKKSSSNETTALEAGSSKSTTRFRIPRVFMINTINNAKLPDLFKDELMHVHIPKCRFYDRKDDPRHQEDLIFEKSLLDYSANFDGFYKELKYELCAIGMHSGDRTTSGHYVAATKNPVVSTSDEWHYTSDDCIRKIKNFESFINDPKTQSEATVLAYRLVDKKNTF